MRNYGRAAIFALLSAFCFSAPSTMDLMQAVPRSKASIAEQREFLKLILANQSNANSMLLFLAAADAIGINQVEDAGFLFFAAQLRARLDLKRYPDGNAEAQQGLGILRQQVGSMVNPEIVKDVETYRKIRARISEWEVFPGDNYFPGWNSGTVKTRKQVSDEAKSIKHSLVDFMGNVLSLLKVPEYHQAMMIIQNYNFSSLEKREDTQFKLQYDEAMKTIESIEKAKNIYLVSNP